MDENGVTLQRLAVSTGVTLQLARGSMRGGVPLVLLPAYADSWWSWSRVMPDLARRFDVLAVDPRGHGGSDHPSCCYGVGDSAMDIVAVLDALEIERAVIVGHSGSCFAARHVAADHPERVAALVLIGSPLKLDRARLPALVDQIAALEDPVPEAFVRDFQRGAAFVPLPEEFFTRLVTESRRMPARVWSEVLNGLLAFDDTRDLAAISTPTTLVWGDRDPIVTRGDQDRLAAGMPDSSLVVLRDTGHSPHWERPRAIIEILEKVVGSVV